MADEKLNTGPEVQKTEEAPAPAVADPAHGEAPVPEHPPEQAGPAEPGDVVISAEQIDALMAEKRQAARAEVEKAEASREQEAGAPALDRPAAESEKAEKPRRGRPPKSDKTERTGPEAEKAPKKAGPRKGRPSKADKAAPDKAQPSQRDKLSRSGGKAPEAPVPPDAGKDTPAKEAAPPEQGVTEPTAPPRPVEEGKLVYLKLSELHPFHTFRPHPFKVRDDAKMQETVASIKLNGVMVPGLARPEKDGNGYEIVAGHRRCRGSELAGLEEMPFIVRDMTDHEAVEAMKDSNKQRDQTLPSELAALLDPEVEDIKHQGSRLKGVAEGDVGKRSVEIVGEAHGMNYKKVMRYLRLNHLVPELMDKVDDKKMGFMPAVELSYIKPKNQRLIAVSIDGEQASPSLAQAKQLRELDKEATLTHILTRQEYCGDVVNFKTTKHFRDKRNHYVDRSQWQITENVHEPIIDRADFETAQRILENAPVRRPNGDGEIHPLSGLLFCKDCGAKMHIRIDYRNGGKRHVAYCSEYHKGKAKKPKCHSPHIIDADLLMQTVAEVLKKIEDYSISNRAEFEALVKKSLAMQQTDQTKKQQKRIPQITTRLEQIDKVLNKLYEDNALGTIPQDRYEQMSQKYSEEYYALKAELATLQKQLSAYENAGGRAQKFLKLTERHAAFTDLTPAILNEFISRIEVHERDQKRAKYAIQHISIYFNYIGRFENEVTQLAEPTEQEIRQMREEIEEAKKEKSRAYHRQYSREYRARNLEKQREYERIKAREYRARRKAQAAAAQPAL